MWHVQGPSFLVPNYELAVSSTLAAHVQGIADVCRYPVTADGMVARGALVEDASWTCRDSCAKSIVAWDGSGNGTALILLFASSGSFRLIGDGDDEGPEVVLRGSGGSAASVTIDVSVRTLRPDGMMSEVPLDLCLPEHVQLLTRPLSAFAVRNGPSEAEPLLLVDVLLMLRVVVPALADGDVQRMRQADDVLELPAPNLQHNESLDAARLKGFVDALGHDGGPMDVDNVGIGDFADIENLAVFPSLDMSNL
jgi:hypothetical protein